MDMKGCAAGLCAVVIAATALSVPATAQAATKKQMLRG